MRQCMEMAIATTKVWNRECVLIPAQAGTQRIGGRCWI
jgi:hypothetical protein